MTKSGCKSQTTKDRSRQTQASGRNCRKRQLIGFDKIKIELIRQDRLNYLQIHITNPSRQTQASGRNCRKRQLIGFDKIKLQFVRSYYTIINT